MNILEQIDQNLTKALKEKDETTISVLRMLKSVIKNKEIEKGKKLEEEEILELINKEAKKRKEAAQAYEEGGRSELAEQEKKELEILKTYLPEQLSEEEIQKIVEETIKETRASSFQDIGKVIGAVMSKVKGRAEGSMVSKIVKEKLS